VATILIADPDPATRSLLELLILRLGHRPIGQRELAEGEEPDLMLLEPASRLGLRLAQRLRRRLPQLRVLCVSIEPPSRETYELGAVGHVMKPFRRSQLERALETALIPEPDRFEQARYLA
jgi:CheY-like chemotaxis protein